jgi:AraC-like DNA-binding protein/mannose-6-phosphate isomerase-like protein (cupin superfamily)
MRTTPVSIPARRTQSALTIIPPIDPAELTGTARHVVQAPNVQNHERIESAPVCSSLSSYHIGQTGILIASPRRSVVHARSAAADLIICLSGTGRLAVNKERIALRPNEATWLPENSSFDYAAGAHGPLTLGWVSYVRPLRPRPATSARFPNVGAYDAVPLRHAIEALHHECLTTNHPAFVETWATLIHKLVLRFAPPEPFAEAFCALWEKVSQNLSCKWTLDDLAREIGTCREAFRRRCHEELGRSPIQHLTQLRLNHASELLSTTHEKIEYIASVVGYEDALAFSAMFKRRIGVPPSHFRELQAR